MVSAISGVSHSAQRAYAVQMQSILSQNRQEERQAVAAISGVSSVLSGQVQAEQKPKEEKKTEQPTTQYASAEGRGKSVNIVV
jgi:hypothetical protein